MAHSAFSSNLSRALFRVLDAGVEGADQRLGQRFLGQVDFAERQRAFLELAVEEFVSLKVGVPRIRVGP